jgi:type I restriction enzyme, S subunit
MNILIKQKTKNIPKLRFAGFLGEWEQKKLGDFLIYEAREVNKPLSSYKAIGIRSHFKGTFQKSNSDPNKIAMDKLYLVKENDFLVNITFAWEGALAIAKKEDTDGYVSHRFPTYIFDKKVTTPDYFRYIYPTRKMKYALVGISPGGAGRNRVLNKNDLLKIKINMPPLPEQQKIASFLGSVDEWISNLRGQKESLEKYKKGMMQKIFSQRIRFKDEGGEDFLKWEEKKLCETCKIKKGKQLNRAELSLRDKYPVINGGVNPSGFTDEWNMEGKTISISEGGNSCGYVNFIKSKFWCGGHCYVLMLSENIELSFLYQLLKFLEKNIMRLRVGSGLPNIQKGDIERLKIQIASFPEQKKIAEFLGSIDNLIESKQQQITQTELWKKGLMQGLFV